LTKKNLKNIIFSNILSLSSAKLVRMFVSIFTSYVKAKILGPMYLGILRTADVALAYSHLSSVSLPFVIRRDLPQLIGEKKVTEAKRLAAIGFTFTITSVIVYVIGLYVFTFFVKDETLRYALYVIIIVILFQTVAGYGNIMAKGLNKYKFLSNINYVTIGINLIIVLPLIYFFSIYGALWGLVISNLIVAIIYWRYIKFGFQIIWDFKVVKGLLFAGIPLLITDIATTIFTSIDRLLIINMESVEKVGLYAVGNMIASPIFMIISTSSIIIFTQLNEKYGKDTSLEVIKKHFEEPIKLLSIIIPVIIGIIILITPLLIRTLLPQYINGITAAQILIFAIFYRASTSFINNALFILNKQKITAYTFIFTGLINTFLSFLAIKYNYGITGVAASTTFSFFLYNVILIIIIYRIINFSFIDILKKIFRYFSFSFFVILCLFILNYFFDLYNGNLKQILFLLLIFVFVSIPFFINTLVYMYKTFIRKK